MSYFIKNLINVESSYKLEIMIGIIIALLIILAIMILTIIKRMKDK